MEQIREKMMVQGLKVVIVAIILVSNLFWSDIGTIKNFNLTIVAIRMLARIAVVDPNLKDLCSHDSLAGSQFSASLDLAAGFQRSRST